MNIVARANDPNLREQLKPQGDAGNTAQGMFILGADGKFYGFWNEHPDQYNDYDVLPIKRFLERGLVAFQAHPPSHIQIPQTAMTKRSSLSPDETTSVVRVFSRISPVSAGSNDLNYGVGRDHYWILANEVQQIVSNAHDNGKSFWMPSSMVARMVRYHLVDNVRGEPDMWERSQIKQAKFYAQFTGSNNSSKCYVFHGDFSQTTADGRRGFKGTIDGRFEAPIGQCRLTRFRAFAQGQAWGSGRFTEGAPKGRFPLVIAMVETNDEISKAVPPEAMWDWTDYYLNPEATD